MRDAPRPSRGRARGVVAAAAVAALLLSVGERRALAVEGCPPANPPLDGPTGPRPGPNPIPGGGGGPTTGGGDGPTTGGPGFLPGRVKDPVPDLPPATTDPAGGATTWVRWWERNKEIWLRYAERARRESMVATPDGPAAGDIVRVREEQDAMVREALVPVFLDALDDPAPSLRASAAVALARCGAPTASKAIRKHVEGDRHPAVRETGVLALGLLGRVADVPYLANLLGDRTADSRSRGFAAFGLGLIGGDDAAEILAASVRKAATDRSNREDLDCTNVLALGLTETASAADLLLRVAQDRRYRETVRATALVALGRMGEPRGVVPAAFGLQDRSSEVRAAAALALGKLSRATDADLVDALMDTARRDSDHIVRHFAILSLGRIGGDAIGDRLQVIFLRSKGEDRNFAAIALGLTRNVAGGLLLREAFASERNDSDLSALAIALGLHGDPQAVPLLRKSLGGRRTQWHEAYAATALAMLGDRASAKVIRDKLLSCRDDDVRQHLAVALGLLGDTASVSALVRTLETARDDRDRGAAAMALGLLRASTCVPLLVEKIRSREDLTVRTCALSALAQIGDPLPVPKLARIVADDAYTLGIDPVDRAWIVLNRR